MLALLDSIDWSAVSTKFLLPVAVLKEKYDKAERIMSAMDGRDPINEHAFRTWPVFRDFRRTEHFKRAFKKIYGRDYELLIETPTVEIDQEQAQDA